MVRQGKTSVKTAIQKAFLDLLLQKAYMDITVSDLVNKAQVARMSFYRNFNSLDDVIDSIADDMIQNFNIEIVPIIKGNNERKWRELLFEMLYRTIQMQKTLGFSFRDFTKAHGNNNVLMDRIHDKILRSESELPLKDRNEKYTVIGRLNLVHGIIREWSLSGMRESPEEIIDIIIPMIMKF